MIKTTRWSPDTCGCVIDYQWDDAVPEDARVHTAVATPTACAAHRALGGVGPIFIQADKENRSKNQARAISIETLAKLRKTNPDGSIDLADAATYQWSWAGTGLARALTISFAGVALTNAEKTQLRTALQNNPARVPVTTTVA